MAKATKTVTSWVPDPSFSPWPVPAFSLPSSDGKNVSDQDLKGHWTVLFLYPTDDTPTCTKEACAFSDSYLKFKKLGAKLYGLSKDSLKDHGKFIAKYGLKMPLLSDESTETIAAFGSWGEKSLYGRAYMGTDRSTFIIDPNGQVRAQWRKVRTNGHVEAVMSGLETLLTQ
jgi:peroxiredoxin Q/BCP